MEQLTESLEIALIRLRCGKTLRSALQGFESAACEAREARAWTKLRKNVDEGRLSAEKAVESFLTWLKFRGRLKNLLDQKTLLPRLQAKLMTAVTAGILILSFFLYRDTNLEASWIFVLISFSLAGTGFLWLQHLQRSFLKSFWYGDWLLFLAELQAFLSWGQSLPVSLSAALDDPHPEWPKVLKAEVLALFQKSKLGQNGSVATPPQGSNVELCRAFEQLNWIAAQYNQGDPITPYLDALVPASLTSFEHKLGREAEKLGLLSLAPLFLCYLPSFFVALLGPVLAAFRSA